MSLWSVVGMLAVWEVNHMLPKGQGRDWPMKYDWRVCGTAPPSAGDLKRQHWVNVTPHFYDRKGWIWPDAWLSHMNLTRELRMLVIRTDIWVSPLFSSPKILEWSWNEKNVGLWNTLSPPSGSLADLMGFSDPYLTYIWGLLAFPDPSGVFYVIQLFCKEQVILSACVCVWVACESVFGACQKEFAKCIVAAFFPLLKHHPLFLLHKCSESTTRVSSPTRP